MGAAIASLGSDIATAASERAEAKQKNEEAIAEAKDAQVQIQNAVGLLKEYYAKSAEATAFVQERRQHQREKQSPVDADAPETFDKPYTGMFPEGGTIVDFLEVVLSDFARLEAETSTSEATQLAEHKKFMFESKKSKALKETET